MKQKVSAREARRFLLGLGAHLGTDHREIKVAVREARRFWGLGCPFWEKSLETIGEIKVSAREARRFWGICVPIWGELIQAGRPARSAQPAGRRARTAHYYPGQPSDRQGSNLLRFSLRFLLRFYYVIYYVFYYVIYYVFYYLLSGAPLSRRPGRPLDPAPARGATLPETLIFLRVFNNFGDSGGKSGPPDPER